MTLKSNVNVIFHIILPLVTYIPLSSLEDIHILQTKDYGEIKTKIYDFRHLTNVRNICVTARYLDVSLFFSIKN